MLIPFRDEPYNRRQPVATYSLIAANLTLFFYMFLGLGIVAYGRSTVPAYGLVVQGFRGHMLVTHMFLHGGWGHVAGNMFFLGFFGRNVERRLGAFAFLLVYLALGVGAGGVQVVWVLASGRGLDVPMVGASGAVFGVVGLYCAAFGSREVRLLIPRLRVVGWRRFPVGWSDTYLAAYWFGFVYLVWNILDGLFLERLTGVAHWAHVGGFAGGLLVGWLLFHLAGWPGYLAEELRAAPRIEDEPFEELGYIPEPEEPAREASLRNRTRPLHRLVGQGGVLRLPTPGREPRESLQTRLMLPGVADYAVVICFEERLEAAAVEALAAFALPHHGSRKGRWARMGVLNRTLTRDGAHLVRAKLRDLGHETVVVPALRLLPLPDPRTVARLGFGSGHLDLVDHRGQVVVLRDEDLLLLSAGRTARAAHSPYFLDLFSDPPLSRWRVNRANFDFRASGLARPRSDHERFQALVSSFLSAFPALPIATAALDLVRGGHPDRYTFEGIAEFEHYNDWVLQILGLERSVRTSGTPGAL